MKQVTDKTLADTGERMIPAYHKGHLVYGEHIVRYEAATELVKDKVVLDIASGSGYGSAFLGTTAKHVFGVDINDDAIKYAQKNYKAKNIEFIKGDGVNIPLHDNSVDVVVSFETIEHIENYRAFMGEIKRVLKNNGLFVLSTPNDVEFPETNHFHIYEFEHKELERLIKKHFKHTKWYFEGTWLYDALLDEKMMTEDWDGQFRTLQTAPIPLQKSLSFFVLCANRPITEAATPRGAIAEHYSERRRQEYETGVRNHIEDQGEVMRHLENTLHERERELARVKQELEQAEHFIGRIKNSLPGKVYARATHLKRRLRA